MSAPGTTVATVEPVPRRGGLWAPFANLVGGQVASTLLGLLFWVFAARFVDAHHVGVAAAAMSTQTLLGLLVSLGLGTHMVAELPRTPEHHRRRLVLRALALVGAVGAVVGVVAVVVDQFVGGSLGTGLSDAGVAPVFVVGVVAAGWVGVLDEAVLGLGRSRLQLDRNLTASLVRFALAAALLGAGARDAVALDVCWVAPLLATTAMVVVRLRLPRQDDVVPLRADARAHLPAALRHYLLNLALAAATLMVPVVSGLVLTTTANASFSVAWLLAGCAYLLPFMLAQALFAHGANDDADAFRAHMRTTLPIALGLSLTIIAGTAVLGQPVLHVFGGRYATASHSLLTLLVAAGLAMVVKDHLITFWRSQRRYRRATALASCALVAEVAGASVGGTRDGAHGLVLGWLAALVVEMLVAVPLLAVALVGRRPAVAAADAPVAPPVAPPTPVVARRFAPWRVVLGVVVAIAAVGLAGMTVEQSRRNAGGTPSMPAGAPLGAPPTVAPVSSSASVNSLACRPTATQPAPLVDVAVQPGGRTPAQVDALVAAAARQGAQVVSTTVSWRQVRPSVREPYRWRGLDEVVRAARQRGLRVRVVVEQTPAWAIVGKADTGAWTPPRRPVELQRWTTFTTDLMHELHGRVSYLEVWPGSDRRATWSTGPDPARFVALLRATYATAHRLDPRIHVVTGGLATVDIGYLNGFYKALDASGTTARPYDLVGLHVFGSPTTHTGFAGYRVFHASMARHGDRSVPLYLRYGTASSGSYARARSLATCTPYVTAVAR